jgi:DNA-directed RNA polymerase subunit omega
MARVTIDDCTDKIESRFDLVLFSAHRARQLLEGITLSHDASIEDRSEKKTVHALREISQVQVTPQELLDSLTKKLQSERIHESEHVAAQKFNIPNQDNDNQTTEKQNNKNQNEQQSEQHFVNFTDETLDEPEEA